jgi:hypothetical protein
MIAVPCMALHGSCVTLWPHTWRSYHDGRTMGVQTTVLDASLFNKYHQSKK